MLLRGKTLLFHAVIAVKTRLGLVMMDLSLDLTQTKVVQCKPAVEERVILVEGSGDL